MDRGRVAVLLPGVGVARRYERAWLRPDLIAGASLVAVAIPAGMAYAAAAGLPPVMGLYATIVPLLVYALVGPSRVLVLGPDSSLAPMIGAAVLPLALGDPDRTVALAGMLAVLMGLMLVGGRVLRLGFLTGLLSMPIRVGYMNGIALVVIAGQLPKLLGISVPSGSVWEHLGQTVAAVADGQVNGAAAAIGVGSLAVIVTARVLGATAKGIVLAVVGAIVLTAVLGLADRIPVAGALPSGLPAPALAGLEPADVLALIGPAAGIALITFADTTVLSRASAAAGARPSTAARRWARWASSNLATGLLGGFPVSGSASRTPVAVQAGARTQLTGVVAAVLLVVFMLVAPGLPAYLPSATLAAVVIAAASSSRRRAHARPPGADEPRATRRCWSRRSSVWRSSACCRASSSPSPCRSRCSSAGRGSRTAPSW